MKHFSFLKYCESFLVDPVRGAQIFFDDKDFAYTYSDLIQASLERYQYFSNSPHNYFALKMESPYKIIASLIGAILAQKKVLILSVKEPEAKLAKIQQNIGFHEVINEQYGISPQGLSLDSLNIDSSFAAINILSSGSSGPSKEISLSIDNIFYSAMGVIDFFSMTNTDTSFSNLPHHHIGGLMIFWRAFFSGGKVTVNEPQNYQFLSLVPLQLKRILFSDDETKIKKLQKCRGILIGGAPLDAQLKKIALEKSIPIFETYGMSETCSLVLLNGRPLQDQEVKLDIDGHFLIRGKTLSPAVSINKDGFYRTNDIGIQNPDGTFSFKYRADLLFKSAGELINPLELEAKIKELNWINEAVIVPINHPEWTQASVLVFKTSEPNHTATEIDNLKARLKTHLVQHFHPHLVPKYFIEAPSDLLSAGIKPRRHEISEFAQEYYLKSLFHYRYIPQNSSKTLLVIFHGFMEDHTDMTPLIDTNKEVNYLLIDLPGHGRTNANNFLDRNSVFFELKSLINFYKKNHELFLFGYSMGGRIAIELTMMGLSPSKIILESSHFGLSSDKEKEDRLASDRNLLTDPNLDLKDFFDQWYKNSIFADYNKSAHYNQDVHKKLQHDPKEWQSSLEFFSPGLFPFTQSQVIESLKNHILILITGIQDKKYLMHFQEIKTKMPNVEINVISGSGHNPHKTHLQEVKMILSFNC